MKKFIQTYTGSLRRLKLLYSVYNLLHPSKLKRYKSNLKKYGIKKSWYGTVSSNDFKHLPQELPWLDRDVKEEDIRTKAGFDKFSTEVQKQILNWNKNGYIILRNFFNTEEVDQMNTEVDKMLNEKSVKFNYSGRKIMFAFKESQIIEKFANNPDLIQILNFILDREVEPFSSINFKKGSEQKLTPITCI